MLVLAKVMALLCCLFIGEWVVDSHHPDITPQVAQAIVQDEVRLDKALSKMDLDPTQRVFVKEMLKKRASQ